MFLLPLLAVALGVPPKRSTSALGVFLSIVMIVTYHKVNQYAAGDRRARADRSAHRLWVPFAVFAALICWMYYTIAYVPGGQPIGALERVVRQGRQGDHAAAARRRRDGGGARMNRCSFFPSRTVSLYMARLFLVRTFAVLAALVLVLQTLDLLERDRARSSPIAGNGDARGVALCRRCARRRSSRASCPSRCCSARS